MPSHCPVPSPNPLPQGEGELSFCRPSQAAVTPHSVTPNSSAIRGVAFRPLPVSTSTVLCSGVIVPAASSLPNAAAACAAVGST